MDIQTLKETLSSAPKTAGSLTPVKEYLASLQTPDKSGELVEAVKECADASRDEDWRVPIGDSGILELIADVLDVETAKGTEANTDLQVQTLRLCGNACAEKDVNRGRLASRPNGMKSLIKAITNDSLLKFAIPVLYNICLDYEDTQKQSIKDGAGGALFTLLKRGNILDDEDGENVLGGALVEHLLMITELLLKHDEFKDTLDSSSISVLLKLVLSPNLTDLEIYAYLFHTITTLLSHETFQSHLINTGTVESLLDILEDSYSRFADDEEESETARKMLAQLRKGLIIALSDVSCNKGFTEKYPLDSSPLLKKLHEWLSLAPASAEKKGDAKYLLGEALQTSACIMLGNVATSDAACLSLVNSHSIHVPLITIMGQKDKDYGTVFSAVGMLRNLVLPADNKAVIGKPETGIWQALETRWLHGIEGGIEKQVPYAVSGLGRLLVKGSRENALRLVENSSQPLPGDDNTGTVSRLSMLLKLYAKSDEIPTKTEIARTLCEILRCIAGWKRQAPNSQAVDEGTGLSIEALQSRIFNEGKKYQNHEMIPEVIGGMVSQDKWPSIKSEGIFALGLLAAGFGGSGQGGELEKEGARLVWNVKREWWSVVGGKDEIKPEPGRVIGEVSSEGGENKEEDEEKKEKENKKPALDGKDFANALVLVAEVRRRLDTELSTEEKEQLDSLLRMLTSSQPGVKLVT